MQKKKSITTRTTISISSAELKQLKELANEERRPVSRQIIYMMEFYKKQKWGRKKYGKNLQMHLLWAKIYQWRNLKRSHDKIRDACINLIDIRLIWIKYVYRGKKMEKRDGLYWGDRERIIRAEEMRKRMKNTKPSHWFHFKLNFYKLFFLLKLYLKFF